MSGEETYWTHVGIAVLVRVHYDFFMKQPRFWYDKNLMEADGIVVNLASLMRKELQ